MEAFPVHDDPPSADVELESSRNAVSRGSIQRWLPLISISVASVGFAFQAFLAKRLMDLDVGSFEIIFFRGLFQLMGCIVVLSITKERSEWFGSSQRNVKFLIARAMTGSTAISLVWLSVGALPLGESQVVQQINPVFIGIYAWIFLQERWHISEAVGAVLVIFGVAVVARPPFLFDSTAELGDGKTGRRMFGLTCGILGTSVGAVTSILIRFLGTSQVAWVTVMLYQAIGQVIVGFSGACFTRDNGWVLLGGEKAWLTLGCGCFGFFGQALLTWGMQKEKAATAALVSKSVTPISAFALQAVFYPDQPITSSTIIGACIILGALALTTVSKNLRELRNEPPEGFLKLAAK
eukprot:TRINITY_DN37153_c0_g1_i1.p1 TRINITY_DN37153_c0_g1~~TRINITY_DN37153_c0_g1_i1.p1  ORF type:complete len:385 (+),score=44.54 TRINITY_DN37153_c0_g1_i1:105-1157(+)